MRAFEQACDRFVSDMGNSQGTALRRGTLTFLKSVRSRTKQSPKMVPLKDVVKFDGRFTGEPNYITPKGHKQKSLHRWTIYRHGGERLTAKTYPAQSRADARKRFGRISQWGLAKKSWGWFMKAMFGNAEPQGNPRAKIDGRMVEHEMRKIYEGTPGVEITLTNRLDYIRAALEPGAMVGAMRAATNQINGYLDKAAKDGARRFG